MPQGLLISTTVTTALAFAVASFLVTTGLKSALHYLLFGVCASAASLSAWAVVTVDQPIRLSAAFLVATPASAVAGIACGLAVARAVAR